MSCEKIHLKPSSQEDALKCLSVDISGIKMKTPVMAASGTFGFGLEYQELIDLNKVGAIVVKGTTLLPRLGNSGRRIAETPGGMLNSIGLENPGVDEFLKKILPSLTEYDVPVIVNIAGNTVEEYGLLSHKLTKSNIAGLEVNISCPNVKEGGIAFGTCPESVRQVVREVKNNTDKPVIVKLSPNVADISIMAKAAEDAGADAISLINTLVGMSIDIKTQRPKLGNIIGGLSGPAIKPVALRMVWQAAQVVKVPIIGMGGIMNYQDAIEFLLAGASAVAVGTANFVNPGAMVEIAAGIKNYLAEHGLNHVGELTGAVKI